MDMISFSILLMILGCLAILIGIVLAARPVMDALREPSSVYSRILHNKPLLQAFIWIIAIFVCASPLLVSFWRGLSGYSWAQQWADYQINDLAADIFSAYAIIPTIGLVLTLGSLVLYTKMNVHKRLPLLVKSLLLFIFLFISLTIIWEGLQSSYLHAAYGPIKRSLWHIQIGTPDWVTYVSSICTTFFFIIVLYVRKNLRSI